MPIIAGPINEQITHANNTPLRVTSAHVDPALMRTSYVSETPFSETAHPLARGRSRLAVHATSSPLELGGDRTLIAFALEKVEVEGGETPGEVFVLDDERNVDL